MTRALLGRLVDQCHFTLCYCPKRWTVTDIAERTCNNLRMSKASSIEGHQNPCRTDTSLIFERSSIVCGSPAKSEGLVPHRQDANKTRPEPEKLYLQSRSPTGVGIERISSACSPLSRLRGLDRKAFEVCMGGQSVIWEDILYQQLTSDWTPRRPPKSSEKSPFKRCQAAALGLAVRIWREPHRSKVLLSTRASREATSSAWIRRHSANPAADVRGWGLALLNTDSPSGAHTILAGDPC